MAGTGGIVLQAFVPRHGLIAEPLALLVLQNLAKSAIRRLQTESLY